ncbi:hypothetical protein D3C86_1989730 [compost metagenome]
MLSSNKFSGKISWSVENLTALENLSLFDNKMHGQIPYSITKIENLKNVNLSYNSFSGSVPKALAEKEDFNLTMVNESGIAFKLKVSNDAKGVLAVDE